MMGLLDFLPYAADRKSEKEKHTRLAQAFMDQQSSVMSQPMGESWRPDHERIGGHALEAPTISPDDLIGTGIPSKLAGLLSAGLKGSAPVFAASVIGGGAKQTGLLSASDSAAKMEAMGMERGWYRGGPAPVNGQRTGPWYTQDADEAAGYANRFGDNAEVREYALPKGKYLDAGISYDSRLAHDVARILDNPYFDKKGAQLAKEFRTFGPDERIGGGTVWQALESRFGNDGAAEVISQLGKFSGAKGMTGGPEAYVFKTAPVRDANRAAFDPTRRGVDDIYGRATVPSMIASGGGGLLGLEALRRNQANE